MHPLVPDFILENYAVRQMRGELTAACMFVDISGFSSMTDVLMQHGSHGAEVLAGVIRTAFSPLIGVVFAQGGLIINQAGDSFTALFPLVNGADAGGTDAGGGDAATTRALASAWQIHEHIAAQSTFATPYGSFAISVKVGLARGECAWQILESKNEARAAYYFRGYVIDRCVEAEHHAGPGEVLVDEPIHAAIHGALSVRTEFEAEPREGFSRLMGFQDERPEPRLFPPRPSRPSEKFLKLASRFYPEAILTSSTAGEFRQVVSLFINLPTVRTEEQLEIFMETVFQLQDRYAGLLSRLSFGDKGSNLLIFWGAPTAYENDLDRALNFILHLQALTEIPVYGGLTYRLAHVGYIGSELAEEYTGYGRGVNLAARFMASAARGEIWIDAPAAQQAGRGFNVEPLGEKRFKGFSQPQEVFLLLDRKEQVERFYEGRLIRRETELAALRRFVQPLFSRNYGGALVVWGEPGMGKSRLVHDFLSQLEEANPEQAQIFLGQCDEILRQSLNPFRYWLKQYFEQSVEHSEARNKRSFNRKLDDLIAVTPDTFLAGELDRTRSCLGALVGLEWSDSLYQQLDAQARFENMLLGLAALLQAESLQRPVIFFLEDAHWLDNDSKTFLPRLLQRLSGSEPAHESLRPAYPVAIIATARYEGAGLPLETFPYAEIRLGELDRTALAALAEAHLGGPLDAALLNLVWERSEGNPFLAEQILRYLQEEGWLVRETGEWQVKQEKRQAVLIPENVQAVLVARLDRLTEEVRQVVQTAAVLGREFEIRLLAEMLQGDTALTEKVERAGQAAIWVTLNEIRYIFRHALMRDAAYHMQIQSRRQALHALALEALERLYLPSAGDDLAVDSSQSPHYGELAYHAEQAGLAEKAIAYLIKAGDAARDAYQNSDAIDFYSRALRLTGAQASNAQLRHLYIERGQALEKIGRYEQALADYNALTMLARERDDRGMELAALEAQAVIFSIETSVQDREHGVQIAQQALDLARALKDPAAEVNALDRLGLSTLFATQNPQRALPYFEQAIALAREQNLPGLLAKPLLNSAATYIFSLGVFDIGQAQVAEAVALCNWLGKPYRAVEGLQNSGLGYMLSGEYPQAIRQMEAADQINKITGSAWGRAMCASVLASVAWEQGEYSRSVRQWEQCIRFGEESGYLMGQIFGRASLGMVYAHFGNTAEATAVCQQALDLSLSKDGAFLGHVLACLSWLLLEQGDLGQAEEKISEAWQAIQRRVTYPIEPNYVAVVDGLVALTARDWPRLQHSAERAVGMIAGMHNRFLLVDAQYLLGRALLEQGKPAEARSILMQARSVAEAIGCRRMLWQVLFTLAQCETETAQAEQWLAQAKETVQFIASQIREEAWHASFLNREAVKAILDGDTRS